jgi:hypothetical protein
MPLWHCSISTGSSCRVGSVTANKFLGPAPGAGSFRGQSCTSERSPRSPPTFSCRGLRRISCRPAPVGGKKYLSTCTEMNHLPSENDTAASRIPPRRRSSAPTWRCHADRRRVHAGAGTPPNRARRHRHRSASRSSPQARVIYDIKRMVGSFARNRASRAQPQVSLTNVAAGFDFRCATSFLMVSPAQFETTSFFLEDQNTGLMPSMTFAAFSKASIASLIFSSPCRCQ